MPTSRSESLFAVSYVATLLVSAIAAWAPYPWLFGALILVFLPMPGGPSPRLLLSWRGQREIFNHPAAEFLRDPRFRRPALLAAGVIYLATGVSVFLGEPRLYLSAQILLLLPLSVVLHSTHGLAALPSSVLDERQVRCRDHAHLRAYVVVTALMLGLLIVASVAGPSVIAADPLLAICAAVTLVGTLPSFLSAVGDRPGGLEAAADGVG